MRPAADLNSLAAILQYCESFAKQMLSGSGEFHPFGAFLDAKSGKVEALGAHSGVEHPTGAEMHQILENFVAERAKAGALLAYGIAANVTIPEQMRAPYPDGIRVHIEAPGYSRIVYTPYRILPFPRIRRFLVALPTVQYAEEISVDVPPKHFAAQ